MLYYCKDESHSYSLVALVHTQDKEVTSTSVDELQCSEITTDSISGCCIGYKQFFRSVHGLNLILLFYVIQMIGICHLPLQYLHNYFNQNINRLITGITLSLQAHT